MHPTKIKSKRLSRIFLRLYLLAIWLLLLFVVLWEINLQIEIFPALIIETKADLEVEGYLVPGPFRYFSLITLFTWVGLGTYNFDRCLKNYRMLFVLTMFAWLCSFFFLIRNRDMASVFQFRWFLMLDILRLITMLIVFIRQKNSEFTNAKRIVANHKNPVSG